MEDVINRVMQLQYDASQRDDLAMWTIYDHPLDFPDQFVARMFLVSSSGVVTATEHVLVADLIETITDVLSHAGLTPLMRRPEDDAKIVATWI